MTQTRLRSTLSLFVGLLAAAAPASPQAAPVLSAGQLQGQLDAWYAKAARATKGTWGIAVATQEGQLLWGIQPTRPMIPASTVKVFTTGYARSILGSNARRHTKVIGTGHTDFATGEWIGSWALELNGDVTLERPTHGGPTLSDLARQLYASGIRRLVGPLKVVSSDGAASASYPAAWSLRHKGRVFAPVIGSLTLAENVLSFAIAPGAAAGAKPRVVGESPLGVGELVEIRARTVKGRSSRLRYQTAPGGRYIVNGTIGTRARVRRFTSTTHDLLALLEASWGRALRLAGIEWQRANSIGAPAAFTAPLVLAEVNSQPFDSIATEVNRRSLNIGAELMLQWAGGHDSPADRLTAHVREVTGDPTIHLVDGSGLSHEDRASPMAFVSYLTRFPLSPAGRGFPMLLPTNGSGTLRKLAKGLPGPGIVRAKTGTLGDVATLTGYLGRPDGVLVISLMYNGPRVHTARQQQWKLFRLLGAEGVIIPQDSLDIAGQLGSSGAEPPAVP
jgi:D-alanyl-D-alanine carboxypeptidase/D-alanyl-D-alanine-endopeptidase (penicillin-binding protein 4)